MYTAMMYFFEIANLIVNLLGAVGAIIALYCCHILHKQQKAMWWWLAQVSPLANHRPLKPRRDLWQDILQGNEVDLN